MLRWSGSFGSFIEIAGHYERVIMKIQSPTFHLAKGGPVIVTSKVTTTRSTMVKF